MVNFFPFCQSGSCLRLHYNSRKYQNNYIVRIIVFVVLLLVDSHGAKMCCCIVGELLSGRSWGVGCC